MGQQVPIFYECSGCTTSQALGKLRGPKVRRLEAGISKGRLGLRFRDWGFRLYGFLANGRYCWISSGLLVGLLCYVTSSCAMLCCAMTCCDVMCTCVCACGDGRVTVSLRVCSMCMCIVYSVCVCTDGCMHVCIYVSMKMYIYILTAVC